MKNADSACVWYVSKYVSPPGQASAGGRGYLIMREIAKRGIRSVIITSDSNQLAQVPQLQAPFEVQEVDGLTLVWVKTLKYSIAKSLRRILSWLHFEWRLLFLPLEKLPRPDTIIVSSLSLLTVLNGFRWRRRFGCRLILEIRDIWPLTIVEEGGFSRYNPLVAGLGMIEALGYRRADAIVGTMPNLAAHVEHVLGHKRDTHCIPMGVDPGALEPSFALPEDYVQKYLSSGQFVVAHVGSIGIANALDTFFECAQAMQNNTRIRFLLVGEGDLRAHYQQHYSHLPNVTFAPRVAKSMVPAVLERCDLVYFAVHESKVWNYGQSLNKVIDYMLAAKPVLASFTGYPSMINEAQCGEFVPARNVGALADAINRFADMDPQERAAMGERGREWILKHRQYDRLASEYLALILPNLKADTTQA
jgi:glycosyltransferase involved in cell wall biosynthesis